MSDVPATTPDKPKRRRRAKRVPDPTTPRRPRTTLLSRIDAMGPTHLSAYRTLAQGNPAFAREVADAIGAKAAFARAEAKRDAADEAVHRADVECMKADLALKAAAATLTRLDTLARQIAAARGDVPADDDSHADTVAPTSGAD